MRAKFIFLVILLFYLTGCTVEYHLDLDENLNVVEKINLYANSDEDVSKFKDFKLYIPINKEVDEYSSFQQKSKSLEYYNMKKNDDKIIFNNRFEKDTYINSTIVNNAYEYVSITKVDGGKVVLSSSIDFLLFDVYENLENVKIIITSKYKLLKTNADVVNRHKYIWNINKDNAKNKNIYLTLDSSVDDRTLLEKIKDGEYTNIFTFSLLLLLFGVIIYLFLKKKSENRDMI